MRTLFTRSGVSEFPVVAAVWLLSTWVLPGEALQTDEKGAG